ncbi:hypothetical protein DID88_009940 [Monilinia fructigena]|uniref:Phosphatidate phosphatase APP1 catalytic domain-containing protein n=1 Tax=Monilinia fructigena TaxID=38457 RepID=A0A395IJR7_9HELO|nr:hypothetical protein DID88_009940 [Monilinia fructigena]
MITPRASLTDRAASRVDRRGVISSAESSIKGLESYLTSVIGSYPSYIASGVPNFFQDFPTGSAVQSSLGISDGDLAASPTQVLNIPGYANWTDKGWNLRVHGNVFKQPNISESKLNDLANVFLVGTSIDELPAAQQSQARNLTAEIFVVQQAHTTVEGDYDQFIQIANVLGLGDILLLVTIQRIFQRLNVYTDGTLTGNATSYLVPESGITVISDIDDILLADTSNADVMKDYPEMVTDFPGQVQLPDDLTNLDIVNGQCYNSTIPQNLTFSEQGLPFGLSKSDAGKTMAMGSYLGWVAIVAAFMAML